MERSDLRRGLFGLALIGVTACTGPAGLEGPGAGSPFAPGGSNPPGTPGGEGLCALPLPPEGCQDTPVLPFPPGG